LGLKNFHFFIRIILEGLGLGGPIRRRLNYSEWEFEDARWVKEG